MDRKNNESHIGGEDLFGDTELTAKEKIAAAEADMAEARAQAAAGGRIAGEARTAGDERWRIAGNVKDDAEVELTAYEELGTQVSDPSTNVTIEPIHQFQEDAAEAARAKVKRLARDERIKAQEPFNERGLRAVAQKHGDKRPTQGDLNIEDSLKHIKNEAKWRQIIELGRDIEPSKTPMETADTVPEARELPKEIIAERDEPTT